MGRWATINWYADTILPILLYTIGLFLVVFSYYLTNILDWTIQPMSALAIITFLIAIGWFTVLHGGLVQHIVAIKRQTKEKV